MPISMSTEHELRRRDGTQVPDPRIVTAMEDAGSVMIFCLRCGRSPVACRRTGGRLQAMLHQSAQRIADGVVHRDLGNPPDTVLWHWRRLDPQLPENKLKDEIQSHRDDDRQACDQAISALIR